MSSVNVNLIWPSRNLVDATH